MYESPALYRMFMRVLYWPHYEDRYSTLADMVPRNASVVDACCGDAYLNLAYLKDKDVKYVGLDSSPVMFKEGIRNKVDVRLREAWSDPIPRADYVIIQGSLCHFIPHSRQIIHKLLSAADKRVLISEPIFERPRRKDPLSNWLSRLFTTPVGDKGTYSGERFTKAFLEKLFIEI